MAGTSSPPPGGVRAGSFATAYPLAKGTWAHMLAAPSRARTPSGRQRCSARVQAPGTTAHRPADRFRNPASLACSPSPACCRSAPAAVHPALRRLLGHGAEPSARRERSQHLLESTPNHIKFLAADMNADTIFSFTHLPNLLYLRNVLAIKNASVQVTQRR